jgi:lysophospholipase L1-like esterase
MRTLAVTCSLVGAVLATASAAYAGPTSGPTAIVSLGDSYISGEGGRFQGNSNDPFGSRNGTDRAYIKTLFGGYYDESRIYLGGSDTNLCHRSDVALIQSAVIPVDKRINLACSGAVTADILTNTYRGEAPQADQLIPVARDNNVKLIVISIGGNDLGFAKVIEACITAWTTSSAAAPKYCQASQQAAVEARMDAALAGIRNVYDRVRAVMSAEGYAPSSYRIMHMGYPSVVPRGEDTRYSETGLTRLAVGGCPMWNRDMTWARTSLVDLINDRVRAVSAAAGVQYVDLRNAFAGHEICAKTTQLATAGAPPSETKSEWGRFLASGLTQGTLPESFHPNAYGQRALGRCVTLMWAATGDQRCSSSAGTGVNAMTLTPIPAP